MKLQTFNATNMQNQRKGDITIRLSRKGASSVSKAAVIAFSLKDGDKISLLQDEDEPADWYLKTDDPDGFELRRPKDADSLCFNNAAMAHAMLDSLGHNDIDSVAFKIATEPTEIDGGG